MRDQGERLRAADFFVFRTPLLPIDTYVRWGASLHAPQADADALTSALGDDRQALRHVLRSFVERPDVREALFVASPSLSESIDHWLKSPASERGHKVEISLTKYFARMSARATPLGLFSGVSTGRIGKQTVLRIEPQTAYQRRTRIDFHYLGALAFALFHDVQFRQDMFVRPNSSLHRVRNSLRFQALQQQDDRREFQYIVADSSPYIDELLAMAAAKAQTPRQMAGALSARHPEITLEEASDLVAQLLDVHLLTSQLEPSLTGGGALDDMLEQLRHHPASAGLVQTLGTVQAALANLDQEGVGAGTAARYGAMTKQLERLPAPLDASRLYHVDLFKPAAHAELGQPVIAEILRGVSVLQRICEPSDSLAEFRTLFRQRYEENPEDVPLQDLLDQEMGLFGKGSAGNSEGQLMSELELRQSEDSPKLVRTWTDADEHRLRLLASALSSGATRIELCESDIEKLSTTVKTPLPDALCAHGTLSALSSQALIDGDFQLHLRGASGPTGGALISRFCYGDAELEAGVRRLLAAEEALQADALFAEIIHLPAAERMGNFIQRPLLRRYEIPYLGRSAAQAEFQLGVSDLTVSVLGQRVVLRSRAHGKQVLPRLTNAHNYAMEGSDRLYSFLCQVAHQDAPCSLGWHWGQLHGAPFLPRVVYGRLVLALATWNLDKQEYASILPLRDAQLYSAVQNLRASRKLPRFVMCAASLASDNWLLVDLDNILSIEAWVQLLGSIERTFLTELFPTPSEMCVEGPEGRFVHELLVPLTRTNPTPRAEKIEVHRKPARVQRCFSEGSEWLYAKLYMSSTAIDDLLTDLGSCFAPLLRTGAMDRFFFVRYGDPFWHLRLRVHGDPARLRQEVLPILSAVADRFSVDGVIWRFQMDTYRREIERYGGDDAIDVCERIFCADSRAIVSVLQALRGDEPPDIRWQLALPGMDRLLDDLGLNLDERLATLEAVAAAFRREFSGTTNLERELGKKQRQLGKTVNGFLREDQAEAGPLGHFLRHFQTRSQAIKPLGTALRKLEQDKQLCRSIPEIAGSLLHMHVNRMLRAHHRPHEVVLYDLLLRHYRSRKAQAK